ncbi:MAG: prepilin-type N-terminal cleavage/methylation domain-containing protein [Pirellula sp.]
MISIPKDLFPKRNRGVTLVAVLVAVGLLMVMMSVTLGWALRNRREARKQLLLTQTTWLCEAGLQRAIRQSIEDSNYQGEQWQPGLPEFPRHESWIQISVESSPTSKSIKIVAELFEPNSANQRFQRSLQYTFEKPHRETTEVP